LRVQQLKNQRPVASVEGAIASYSSGKKACCICRRADHTNGLDIDPDLASERNAYTATSSQCDIETQMESANVGKEACRVAINKFD